MSNQITIRDQHRLGFGRTLGLTLNGMRHRLGRSGVTLMVVAVAIAFMMSILGEGLVKRRVAEVTTSRTSALRLGSYWMARLSRPGSIREILEQHGAAALGDPILRESAHMGGMDDAATVQFSRLAASAMAYLRWIEALDYGQRRRLVRNATGVSIFDYLQSTKALQRFKEQLQSMTSLHLVADREPFEDCLTQWLQLKQWALQIREGRRDAIGRFRIALGARPLLESLQETDGPVGRQIRRVGFELDDETATLVARQARRMVQAKQIEQTVAVEALRRKVATRLDLLPGEVQSSTLWSMLTSHRHAAWYVEQLQTQRATLSLPLAKLNADVLVKLAEARREESTIERASRLGSTADSAAAGRRILWLVLVSVVVCVVGITNAMFVSVAQRFGEIATLKCLGALDGFIALSFILEACLLGLFGGLIGAAMGLLVAMGRMWAQFHGLFWTAFPYDDIAVAVLGSLTLGVVLAGIATILPALKAARLAPMEAMRVE